MPYIPSDKREAARTNPCKPGELNYAITYLILRYMENTGQNYTAINDILGALEGAKLEFARRIMAPYENRKRIGNGDVYPQ